MNHEKKNRRAPASKSPRFEIDEHLINFQLIKN